MTALLGLFLILNWPIGVIWWKDQEEFLPIQFQIQLIIFGIYGLIFRALTWWLGKTWKPVLIKRLISSLTSGPLGWLALDALFFDAASTSSSWVQGSRTWASQAAMGALQGCYAGDLFWITPEQRSMPSFLLHHFIFLVSWQVSWFVPQPRWFFLLGQTAELFNPCWYAFWIIWPSKWHLSCEKWKRLTQHLVTLISLLGYLIWRLFLLPVMGVHLLSDVLHSWPWPVVGWYLTLTFFFILVSIGNSLKLINTYFKAKHNKER